MNTEAIKEKAKQNFTNGMNCAQAVFCAFVEEYPEKMGIDKKTAMKLSSSFGGGMGRLREVCGAVSGMFMSAGILFGYDEDSEPGAKQKHYELIQELAKAFAEKNGAIVCRELLGLPAKTESLQPDSPKPEARTEKYYKTRPCVELVGDATEIFAAYIEKNGL